jgi:DNA-binding transcriptional ArsR family regulator
MHDEIWKALADPNRRSILDELKPGPLTTGDICAAFPSLDRCTTMKHLEALTKVGLVVAERRGRTRLNHLNAAPLHSIVERWVSGHTARLAESASRLKRLSEEHSHE